MRTAAAVFLFCLLAAWPLGGSAAEAGGGSTGDSPTPPAETEIEVGAGSDTVTEALQGQDGVRIQTMCTHCNSANIQVGGLAQDLVPVFRAGYPVFGGLATSMVLSILPADSIAEAQVVKGPRAADEPGPAAGGVIRLIESTPEELAAYDLGLEIGSYRHESATVRVAGPMGSRISGMLVAGRETAEPVDDDDDGWNDVSAVNRDFAEGRLNLTVGSDHEIDLGVSWIDEDSLDGRGAFDRRREAFEPTESGASWTSEDTLVERRELRAGWEWKAGRGRTVEARVLSADRDLILRSQDTAIPNHPSASNEFFDRFDIEEANRWGAVHYRQPVGLDLMVRSGVEVETQEVDAVSITPPAFPGGEAVMDPALERITVWSGFADVEWNPSPAWSLQLGLRYDDADWDSTSLNGVFELETTRRSRSRLSPRSSLRFSPASGWTLKLIAGQTFRPPRSILEEVCCGQRYQLSADVDAETGRTVGFEGIYQPSPDLRVSLYTARTDFDDHILRMVGASSRYVQTYTLVNVPEARAETAEIAVRWSPQDRVTLDSSLGWTSFHRIGDEQITVEAAIPGIPSPILRTIPIDRVPYTPVRTASLGVGLSLPRGVNLSAQGSYTGEMLIQQFDENVLFDELRRTSDFWLVGLSFEVPVRKSFEIVGGVDNLTDEIQDDLGDPTTDYNWGPRAGRSWRLGLRYRMDR